MPFARHHSSIVPSISTGITHPETDSIRLGLIKLSGMVKRAVKPRTHDSSIAPMSLPPLSRLEKSPQMDGMYSGHSTIVMTITTTFSAPPASGTSIAMPIITSPKTSVNMRPARMRCFSLAPAPLLLRPQIS